MYGFNRPIATIMSIKFTRSNYTHLDKVIYVTFERYDTNEYFPSNGVNLKHDCAYGGGSVAVKCSCIGVTFASELAVMWYSRQ